MRLEAGQQVVFDVWGLLEWALGLVLQLGGFCRQQDRVERLSSGCWAEVQGLVCWAVGTGTRVQGLLSEWDLLQLLVRFLGKTARATGL